MHALIAWIFARQFSATLLCCRWDNFLEVGQQVDIRGSVGAVLPGTLWMKKGSRGNVAEMEMVKESGSCMIFEGGIWNIDSCRMCCSRYAPHLFDTLKCCSSPYDCPALRLSRDVVVVRCLGEMQGWCRDTCLDSILRSKLLLDPCLLSGGLCCGAGARAR